VSKDTVYTRVISKGMPGHKVCRCWKFKREGIGARVFDGGAASSSDEAFTKSAVKVRCHPRVTHHGGATKTAVGGY
jgi:hypothetical protein